MDARNGQILILAILFMAVIMIISAALFGRVAQFVRFDSNSILKEQAGALAESGIERAVWELNKTAGEYPGDSNEVLLGETDSSKVTITPISGNLKRITSTGYVGGMTNPRAKRTIQVEVFTDSAVITFNYAVQTGTGGLSMANSSTINGNVYSNGNIAGSGSSTINGEAYAVGTISSPDPAIFCPKPKCDFPQAEEQDLPIVNYQQWKDAAVAGDTESTNCTISTSTSIGPKKYDCNLSLTNNAIVTLNGPIWVTGTFSMSQGGTVLKLNDNFGSNGTVVIIDGTVDLTQGGSFQPTNSNPKGYILLVTTSTANPAITLSQSGATAIFYALDGGAELSQSANVFALAAKSLSLRNSATLDYQSGLASSIFATGPGASWQIKKGTYKFVSSP